jgi:hypothetical protein
MASTSEKLELKIVGTRPIRPDGVDKVMGCANFGADMSSTACTPSPRR